MQEQSEGRSSENLHTKCRGLSDVLFLFYFQTNAFSALGTHGTWLRASERLTGHTSQFKS